MCFHSSPLVLMERPHRSAFGSIATIKVRHARDCLYLCSAKGAKKNSAVNHIFLVSREVLSRRVRHPRYIIHRIGKKERREKRKERKKGRKKNDFQPKHASAYFTTFRYYFSCNFSPFTSSASLCVLVPFPQIHTARFLSPKSTLPSRRTRRPREPPSDPQSFAAARRSSP
jgi:hypothetical protein